MTAFLKIDQCSCCQRALPWVWLPAVVLGGRALAGTGVWHSQLDNGRCPECVAGIELQRQKEQRAQAQRDDLARLLGGKRAYREFTFESYDVTEGNQRAFQHSNKFNPSSDNLYLWGPCGVGKTHLASAADRRCFNERLSVIILRPGHLVRRLRMKEPGEEVSGIQELVNVVVLIIDDLGVGPDTAYSRQMLQEVLDERRYNDRAGLLVTSKYSLDELAAKMADDSIPSRLAGLCHVVAVRGADHRLMHRRG